MIFAVIRMQKPLLQCGRNPTKKIVTLMVTHPSIRTFFLTKTGNLLNKAFGNEHIPQNQTLLPSPQKKATTKRKARTKSGVYVGYMARRTNNKIKNKMTRLQFFIDHIGKPVFRARNGCKGNKGKPCSICEYNYQNGLIVEDRIHASSLASIEGRNKHKILWKHRRKERQ